MQNYESLNRLLNEQKDADRGFEETNEKMKTHIIYWSKATDKIDRYKPKKRQIQCLLITKQTLNECGDADR